MIEGTSEIIPPSDIHTETEGEPDDPESCGYSGCELRNGSPAVPRSVPDALGAHAVYDRDGRWVVESLLMGDGTEDSRGLVLRSHVAHASAQGIAPSEEFHPIRWDASLFEGAREGEIRMQAYVVPGTRLASSKRMQPVECMAPGRCRALSRFSREDEVARHVLGFLRKCLGMAVRISGIGL